MGSDPEQTPQTPVFTVQVAARLVGITRVTLRAWEIRHGFVRPARTRRGQRLYSQEDIDRLREIKKLLDGGASHTGIKKMLGRGR